MDTPETHDELLEQMYGNRAALVKAVYFYNGEANRQEIRTHGDIPKGSMHDLCTTMEAWDVIEHVGNEPVGRGGRAAVYQFTELGETISGPVVDSATTVDDVETHEERIDDLEQKYEEMSAVLNAIRTDLRIEVDNGKRGG